MKYILIISLLVFYSAAFAQTLLVKDLETGEPLEGVFLSSGNSNPLSVTDWNGETSIGFFRGSEKIEIRALGYKTITRSFTDLKSANFEVQLDPVNLNLEEVVVSVTRWKHSSGDSPSKVITISSKQATLQNPQTAADLLGVSGKVYIQKSQQGGGSPMIRGFATNRLLYSVDGVRMNTAIFRGGNIQNVISLDPFAMESTEVLFGPGSVIYGSDAIGGVMSFQTLTPKFSQNRKPRIQGKVVARHSTANREKTGHIDLNIGWKKWALLSSISSWDYDHLKQGKQGPEDYIKSVNVQGLNGADILVKQEDPLIQVPSAYSQVNMMNKVRFEPNPFWDFHFGLHHSQTSPYGRYDRHNRMREGLPRYAEWDYGPQKWMMTNISVNHRSRHSLFDKMTIRLAQQSFEESRRDRVLFGDQRTIQTENVLANSLNADFLKFFGDKNTLSMGMEYVSNDVKSKGMVSEISTGLSQKGPSRYPKSKWQSFAIYTHDQYKIKENLSVQAGLRYNRIYLNAEFDTSFYNLPFQYTEIRNGGLTGSLGSVYRPSKSWILSANFGTAFRSPNVDDIGKIFDSEPGAVTVPNPDLKAEYALNLDIGIAKVLGDIFKVDLSGYYTYLQNAMVRRDFSFNGQDSMMYNGILSKVQSIQNAAVAHVYGLQAGLEADLPIGFGFSTDLNYQVGQEELDDGRSSASRHAAPFFGVSRLIFNYRGLDVQLYTIYQGKRAFEDLAFEEQGKDEIYAKDKNGQNYSPAWHTLNFKFMYRFSDRYVVSGGIENLTSQRYRYYSSGISEPGQNFILSLQANF